MDEIYKAAMQEQLAQLEEEFNEINLLLQQQGYLSSLVYRATERNLQLLIEACIGISKQTLKALGKQVPSDARQAFAKLKAEGKDNSQIDWKLVIGMRNALVHDYLNLEQERILQVIKEGHYQNLFTFAKQQLY